MEIDEVLEEILYKNRIDLYKTNLKELKTDAVAIALNSGERAIFLDEEAIEFNKSYEFYLKSHEAMHFKLFSMYSLNSNTNEIKKMENKTKRALSELLFDSSTLKIALSKGLTPTDISELIGLHVQFVLDAIDVFSKKDWIEQQIERI